jgi:nicotinamidase-related amidase
VRSARRASPNLSQERCSAALLLIDVINRFDFDGSADLLKSARPAALAISRLKERAIAAGVPVIYVNDNFGRWRSDFRAIVRTCRAPEAKTGAREIVERLAPRSRDYFVLKPNNSAFYATVLETLLRHLGAETLILAGFATDNCVLFSAHDAYLRGFRLLVPRDCVAAESSARQRNSLAIMTQTMKADVRASAGIDLARLMRRS